MAYELTETGKEKVHSFIAECTMRSKNQDAGTDKAENKTFPTEDRILSDLDRGNRMGHKGDYHGIWCAVNEFGSDYALDLKFGEDFVKVVPCSALQADAEVVFMAYSAIHKRKVPEVGTVLWVDEDEKTIAVVWLDGYKSRTEDIPYEDMLAVYDKTGTEMSFGCFRGPSAKLIAK
jgi:hypothetical protein